MSDGAREILVLYGCTILTSSIQDECTAARPLRFAPIRKREILRVSACARERVHMYEERECAQNVLTDYAQYKILYSVRVSKRACICARVCVRARA